MRPLTFIALGCLAWVTYCVATSKTKVALNTEEGVAAAGPWGGNGASKRPKHLLRVRWHVRVPENTPLHSSVYVCGNHAALGAWEGVGFPLRRETPDLYVGELQVPEGTVLEYKFTRGSWGAVETLQDGTQRPNRSLAVYGPELVHVAIEAWSDQA